MRVIKKVCPVQGAGVTNDFRHIFLEFVRQQGFDFVFVLVCLWISVERCVFCIGLHQTWRAIQARTQETSYAGCPAKPDASATHGATHAKGIDVLLSDAL